MAGTTDDLIGSSEAAEILGWGQRKVQRAASTGAIPIVGEINHGRHVVFRREQIEALAQQEKSRGDEPEENSSQP